MSTQDSSYDQAFQAALALPSGDRVRLAEQILDTVEKLPDDLISPEDWQTIDRRLEELEAGKVVGLTQEEFFERLNSLRSPSLEINT